MYYGQRDKIMSVRVSSKLLNEVNTIINSYTESYSGRGDRKYYNSHVPGYNSPWEKLSVADIIEKALINFVETTPRNPNKK